MTPNIDDAFDGAVSTARAWIAADPDPRTVAELTDLLDRAPHDPTARVQLVACCGGRLAFGTAGIRGQRGAGPNRMNRLLVRQSAAGLGDTLTARFPASSTQPVLVGRDARWMAEDFASDVAEVLSGAGLHVVAALGPQPTPFIAWTMRQIDACAAVVVTASHNPPADSGLKIYGPDGAQIISPTDEWIAEAIERHRHSNPPGDRSRIDTLDPSWIDRYTEFVASFADGAPQLDLRVATTALHGVGSPLLRAGLEAGGVSSVVEVASQRDPDPDFPTVAFPNPEESGATDLLLELAESTQADIALAVDPDADRLAVGCGGSGGWSMFTGDDVGALFTQGLLATRAASDRPAMVVSTVVSSRLAGRIATARHATHVETLTGFKWLSRPALDNPDVSVVLAYEEALGYAVGGLLDKDGISAAVSFAALCRRWKAADRTPRDVLDDLHVEFGAHVQRNFSLRLEGPTASADIAALAGAFADNPPIELGHGRVTRSDRPAPDVIRLYVGSDDRVVVRPSGTEPKLKFYCEAVEPVGPEEGPETARDRARQRLSEIDAALAAFMSDHR